NTDGSEAQTCGNGMRCVVAALSRETGRRQFRFGTLAGILEALDHGDGRISVDMGVPRFGWNEIPLSREFADTRRIELAVASEPEIHSPSAVSMGNPHVIFW